MTTNKYIYTYVYTYIYTYMYTYIYTYIYIYIYLFIYIYTYTFIRDAWKVNASDAWQGPCRKAAPEGISDSGDICLRFMVYIYIRNS